MRTFVISISLFLLLLCCIIINSIYLTGLTEKMLVLANGLPETIYELSDIWEQNRNYVGITVNYSYIYTISTSIISTKRLYEGSCEGEFEAARDILYEAIMRLHELERFSLDNII